MLLKELHLHNFRQYKGDQSVYFSEDPMKNVTLLLGKNTSGKTTFIQAFRWVLYNNSDFTGRGRKSAVLNDDVRMGMRMNDREDASVKLVLIHNNILYEITRKEEYYSKTPGDAYATGNYVDVYFYNKDGERRQVAANPNDKISDILPQELSEYFFFDGEKIANSRTRTNVEDSINTIMGLKPLKQMMDHLNSNKGRSVVNSLMALREPDDDDVMKDLERQLKIAQNDSKNNEELLESTINKIKLLEPQYDKAFSDFVQIEDIADKANELKELDKKKTEKERQVQQSENDLMSSFTPMMMELYLSFLSDKINKELISEDYADKGIPEMTAVSVNYLLERGICVCGSDLNQNPRCRESLIELLSYLPPESIGSQIKQLENKLGIYIEHDSASKNFDLNLQIYHRTTDELIELETNHDKLEREIGNHKDAESIRDSYRYVKSQLDRERENKEKYFAKKTSADERIDSLEDKIKQESKKSGKNQDVDTKIRYALELYKNAKQQYENNSVEVLNSIRSTLESVFSSMYHGKRTISLGDDYSVTLSVNGSYLDTSKGLETVANFAFISSLLKVAKDRVSKQTGLISEPYPLAMDAVFSNTDEKHILNICSQLPSMSEQAVLALMDKDWQFAKETLSEHVGKAYRIDKISESYSKITEVSL